MASLKETDLFFVGNSNEIRAQKVYSLLNTFYKGPIYSLNYDIEFEKYTIEQSSGKFVHRKENIGLIGKDLMQDFKNDLDKIGLEDKNILIDITSIKHPILFYFLALLRKDYKPKSLVLTYTEPEEYIQQKVENVTKKFDLTEKFCSVKPLPGFLRVNDYNKERLLVALMGFEGNRFSKAFEDVNPATRKTYAVVGFPSFQPGWQYYVYSENQYALEQSRAYALIKRATANEPFGAYNILNDIKINNPDYEITIAPIGTKPHSLGACMFAIDNEDVQLYYDFPSFGDKKRTIGVGNTFLYNLTDFINKSI
ncbi:hypothetical protein NAT51_18155 [Flavobacterium amniphilum]|uniref:hypothetical protein n=1 Tax=Flavobacterium amniphilum TaxID=1834035 RepID=UPI00202A1412|nr:hypothetical protein [Flavobacterium amniphilum]MCL9807456.1 hypothetical protein [Flavobacterium amniphilum]